MLENRGLEIIILAAVVLLLFGANRLPDSARALGKSLRVLKSEMGAMKADSPDAEPQSPSQAAGTIQAAPEQTVTSRPLSDFETPPGRSKGKPVPWPDPDQAPGKIRADVAGGRSRTRWDGLCVVWDGLCVVPASMKEAGTTRQATRDGGVTAAFEHVSLAAPGHRPGGGRSGVQGAGLTTEIRNMEDSGRADQVPRVIRSEAGLGLAVNPSARDSPVRMEAASAVGVPERRPGL
ncbi:Sec-independent protein translocase subunit TatA [Streptacidiphilus sp. 4-A2]|nr:Sec-independent protein translocase subunit TatA [Streptacidiphilus sp. 4-A2]